MTTMNDVARRAGVSGATVSRVLNGRVPVNASTRKRVEEAIKETGYRPNILAGSLSTGRTWTIGISVPIRRFPHFTAVLQSIVHHAAAGGFAVLTGDSGQDAASEQQSINPFLERRVDGMILADRREAGHPGPMRIPEAMPLVFMQWPTDGAPSSRNNQHKLTLHEASHYRSPEEIGLQAAQLLLSRINSPGIRTGQGG